MTNLADSYREARLTARAASALDLRDEAARWERLGALQVIAELAETATRRAIHPGLQALIANADTTTLVETLEVYLDAACNAQVAAEELHLHRGSLYYRLQRVEELAHTTLHDGQERLSLHLELKLSRLTGEYRPRRRSGSAQTIAREHHTTSA
jgi:DNA-binding PucR family transcriptional regulator